MAFWEPPCGRREGAGSLRERGLGAAFPPFQQPAGRARNPPAIESAEKPSTWRKRGTDLPTIETAIPRLREIFAGADEIIGYNVGFDLGFLSAVGVRPREDARITDTMNEFTWFMGRRYKLVDAADHIGYEWTGRAHGSLADARATLAVQRWLEQWLVAE
ncbi:3'-5' exonuclease [Dorea sp. AF36-15AT]|uniref:3'-5' exonuclease n=1 Tax=Dorea sp. AF36-15AT TaxID=2292041 RepID=UPI000E525618|nr:3'-5' exonuclease [Dorea sp. AF36-15AT]RHP07042.1 3'-5' exonuclease [Dorea sp. AF36-15AT]